MTPARSVSTIGSFVFAVLCSPLNAGTIDLSTGPANWTVSIPSAGVSNATPFGNGGSDGTNLKLDSVGNGSGTWVTGGSFGTFDGFWVADLTFTIPAGATGVTLSFSGLHVDDRAVVSLNGASFASLGGGGGGLGEMMFVDGGPNNSYTFLQNLTGTLTSGFNIGGPNTIEWIINNTGNGISGAPHGLSGGDYTSFALDGTLSYSPGDTSTPEPGSMGLIAAGLALVAGRAVRRRP
jgi:hypothetical protein